MVTGFGLLGLHSTILHYLFKLGVELDVASIRKELVQDFQQRLLVIAGNHADLALQDGEVIGKGCAKRPVQGEQSSVNPDMSSSESVGVGKERPGIQLEP